jgi:hypothetical protein
MFKSYEALYENGQLKFLKDSPNITNAHVIITVIEELSPPKKLRQPSRAIAGKGKTLGDIVNPLLDEGDWECLNNGLEPYLLKPN